MRQTATRQLAMICGLAIALAALSGCGTSTPEPVDPSPLAYEGGPITEAEYHAIVVAIRSCMVDKGYDASPVELRADGLTYTFTISGGGVGDESTPDDWDECSMRFNFWEAEVAYQDQNSTTGAEREALFEEFIVCMDEAGFPGVTPQDDYEEITDRIAVATNNGELDSEAFGCLTDYAPRLFGASH